ncbi:MAG: hypothetical protein WBA93_27965 [Microcoleaceae cyanobacterium]
MINKDIGTPVVVIDIGDGNPDLHRLDTDGDGIGCKNKNSNENS